MLRGPKVLGCPFFHKYLLYLCFFFHRLATISELLLTSDRYARNAEAHEFDHGCRSGIGRCLSHGWAIQRRVSYFYLFIWIRLATLFGLLSFYYLDLLPFLLPFLFSHSLGV